MEQNLNMMENKNLLKLAQIFVDNKRKLYVVGGAVRDFLLGLNPKKVDFDICSNVSIEDLKVMLNETGFEVQDKNIALGVVNIIKDSDCFEYARFRSENYEGASKHNPCKVDFVDDISIDVKRRDFTINAIYYDINARTIVDLCNGVEDLLNRKIRTVLTPQKTLSVDPARILRMVQFALRLGFEIDEITMNVAIKNAVNIENLSQLRKEKELNKINNASDYYSNFSPNDISEQKTKLFNILNIK